jgi:hypothetical protein
MKRHRLLKHFGLTVNSLALYKPAPLRFDGSVQRRPDTFLQWAERGVYEDCADDVRLFDSLDATGDWALRKRTDFGPCGWETLLPVENTSTIAIPGNHFTMMTAPHVSFNSLLPLSPVPLCRWACLPPLWDFYCSHQGPR